MLVGETHVVCYFPFARIFDCFVLFVCCRKSEQFSSGKGWDTGFCEVMTDRMTMLRWSIHSRQCSETYRLHSFTVSSKVAHCMVPMALHLWRARSCTTSFLASTSLLISCKWITTTPRLLYLTFRNFGMMMIFARSLPDNCPVRRAW